MPFTLAHPAAILPFRYIGRKYFSLTGLIVGSIIPDFEYFIRIENRSHFSHTIKGIFWFDLPMGLLVCFLYHGIVKGPLTENSPYYLYSRLYRFNKFNWSNYLRRNWVKVVYSIFIGVLTHIISDKITHKSSNLVSAVPGILENQELIETPKSIYRVIQITVSIIGLGLCAMATYYLPRYTGLSTYNPNNRYWLLMAFIFALTLATIIMVIGYKQTDLIISSMSASMLALFVSSLIALPHKKMLLVRR